MEGGSRSPMRTPFPSRSYSVGDHDLGHGGQNTIYDQTGAPSHTDTWQTIPEVDEYYRKTAEEKQKRYAGKHLPAGGHGGGHFCIFPNVIIDHWRILNWHPHGVGVTESWRSYPVDKKAPKVVRDALRRYAMRYCGPTGMTESDDMENWNYCFPASKGTIAQRLPYNFEMGLGHAQSDEQWPEVTLNYRISEEPARARFSRWLDFMKAGSWDDLYPVKKK